MSEVPFKTSTPFKPFFTILFFWRLIASRNVNKRPGWNHETAIGWRSKKNIVGSNSLEMYPNFWKNITIRKDPLYFFTLYKIEQHYLYLKIMFSPGNSKVTLLFYLDVSIRWNWPSWLLIGQFHSLIGFCRMQ